VMTVPSSEAAATAAPPEPGNLAVAIRVAQKMLATYGDSSGFDVFAFAQAHGGLAEALRILLRALDAEAGENQ
jgi:hypothetical protein